MELPAFLKFRQKEGPLGERIRPVKGTVSMPMVPRRLQPTATYPIICGFCSTGCGLRVHMRGKESLQLSPDPDYPVNLGKACPKGWESLAVMEAEGRAQFPRLRDEAGNWQRISWDAATSHFVAKMRAVQRKYGEGATAFISTGQMCTEEMAFLGTLARFGMGMRHGDGNTRQCMATSVVAYKQSFGFDAPPFTYKDFEESDVIILVGSNLCIAHPILWQRVKMNQRNAKVVVIDPRFTETAAMANMHVSIAPKGDLLFFLGVAKRLLEKGWLDREFIARSAIGFEEFENFLRAQDWVEILRVTGQKLSVFEELASLIKPGQRTSIWWTMGVNQSHEGVSTAQAIINLCLMTGQIGKAGTGANSITGQCNAMGSRLFSNTSSLIGGHDFAKDKDRKKVAGILGIEEAVIPRDAGYAYDQILDAVDRGEIKGLWIIATNTAHSWIDQNRAKRALAKLDFLCVQDIFQKTETMDFAHLALPAAGWGEKDGCFINSERRIGRARALKAPPGEALADFYIFRRLAESWGLADMAKRWESPAAALQILKQLSAGQPCDIAALRDHEHLEEQAGLQWPIREENPPRERRLFEDGRFYHEDGKARFIFRQPRAAGEQVDEDFPLLLLTGRGSSGQWHTETRTRQSAILQTLQDKELLLTMHPFDASARGFSNGQEVKVFSRRGELRAKLDISVNVQMGQLFLPMHHPDVNRLTFEEVDPFSRQPSYKFASVNVAAALKL